jgi:3'-phosphoadenosine 5'-phosphosulfate sulfotransferase (PAPS reductase)/FAD synthetase
MKPGPDEIVSSAIEQHKPVAIYVGYSGGNDSLRVTHWAMTHVPGCRVMHINTGIGIERTRLHVRAVCKQMTWPLDELRAFEDCGQDYESLCRAHGFPGPDGHNMMYARLKERCVRLLLRRAKKGHHSRSKVMLISGLQHDDSKRRMRYAGREINTVGSQLWVNPFYWSSKAERDAYISKHNLPINPVTKELGMSGECGCGAFAQKGELERWRKVDPSFGERIDKLSEEVLANGFTWSWEGHPPSGGFNPGQSHLMPLCGASCYKSAVVREEA